MMPESLELQSIGNQIAAYLNGKLGRHDALDIRRRVMADAVLGRAAANVAEFALRDRELTEGDPAIPDIADSDEAGRCFQS